MHTIKSIGGAVVIFCIVLFGGWYFSFHYPVPQSKPLNITEVQKGPLNATYVVNGKPVTLVDGVAEQASTPGSASKVTTRYFGNEVRKDVDGDGREDVVFLLTQETGGSGTFFYVVASLNKEGGYVGSQGLLIGDRIAPQTTESGKGRTVVINYADRAVGEAFSTPPSHGVSLYLLLDPETRQFGEVVQNFEGEADPSRMTLGMTTWYWIETRFDTGNSFVPKKEKAFTLTFKEDGTFKATTDCNTVSGAYTVSGEEFRFSKMASTMMFCEGSEEQIFSTQLGKVHSFQFTSRGELLLELPSESGTIVLR
ncbi:MAG: META domain-containing protein [Candidatus Taylorbacteria bacterium]|nr:META domain-containing protein [Candidatus Taylorbacteria bacterium]